MAGKYGPPGGALLLFRTYPRIPFYEQIHDNYPFYTDTGRLHAYSDDPTALECGENFIVHREGPEATPYLPNVIVSSNPLVRPNDYGIPLDAEHWDERTVRNVKLPWAEVKKSKNFLWEKGFQFYCLTPEVAPQRALVVGQRGLAPDLELQLRRPVPHRQALPNVGEHQIHMNPRRRATWASPTATTSTWTPIRPIARTSARPKRPVLQGQPAHAARHVQPRLSLPRGDDEARLLHRHREDGEGAADAGRRAVAHRRRLHLELPLRLAAVGHAQLAHADAPDRHAVPQDQGQHEFIFGGEADNHAVNTVPKECLIRITKAEDGGLGGKGPWKPARTACRRAPRGADEQVHRRRHSTGKGERRRSEINPRAAARDNHAQRRIRSRRSAGTVGMALPHHEDTSERDGRVLHARSSCAWGIQLALFADLTEYGFRAGSIYLIADVFTVGKTGARPGRPAPGDARAGTPGRSGTGSR
jgi:nitrate reductase alpha subunit